MEDTSVDIVFGSSGDVQDGDMDSWTNYVELYTRITWSNEIDTPFFSGWNL